MIKFENTEITGWEHAIRGMRNPLNSWGKIDSYYGYDNDDKSLYIVGDNDLDLMKRLRKAGTDHRKYMRMITVYVDITAPLYWWKEFDTYKVGTVANSCSTMHKIQAKEFTLDDFSHEHLGTRSIEVLEKVISLLNVYRNVYVNAEQLTDVYVDGKQQTVLDMYHATKKEIWWQMIQLLPSSYNQKRTVMMNYEVLANIYKSRKHHKLDEWSEGFIQWIESLPHSELIIGE
jgi:hypothetical protein